ncbi:conserved hypothetical protein [Xanthomonas phaseoli pv. phaseoli]|uniref:Uncharacterized protein n=1 Tax=Xanthomonas campestris pv. phaseoli TaxID=317013 RepID=A0A7Z7J1R7_XANCH|nr:conserved hypothetical protein [Xanthomonas phaseoli pv. phaseoli]
MVRRLRARRRPIHPCWCLRLFIHRAKHAGQNAFRLPLRNSRPAYLQRDQPHDQLHGQPDKLLAQGQAQTLSDMRTSVRGNRLIPPAVTACRCLRCSGHSRRRRGRHPSAAARIICRWRRYPANTLVQT